MIELKLMNIAKEKQLRRKRFSIERKRQTFVCHQTTEFVSAKDLIKNVDWIINNFVQIFSLNLLNVVQLLINQLL